MSKEDKARIRITAITIVVLAMVSNQKLLAQKLSNFLFFSRSYPAAGPQSYSEQIVFSLIKEPLDEPHFVPSTPTLEERMGNSSGSPVINANDEIIGWHSYD